MSAAKRSVISGLGINLPPEKMMNSDLEKLVETSDEWIFTRTGIRERRIAGEGMTASALGAPAAKAALDAAGPNEIELFAGAETAVIPGAGHMVHFEQPDALAAAIEDFLIV